METEHTDNAEDNAFPYDMHTFREWVNSIRQQINQMKEAISDTYDIAHAANMLANTCESGITKLMRERESTTPATPATPATPSLPDSNGFWRDTEGDIWSYDGNPDHHPSFLFDNEIQEVCETPTDITANWADLEDYAPFTKISNPFHEGDHHAD